MFLWLWSWAPLLSLCVIYIFALLGRTDSRQAHRRRIWDGTWDTLAPNQNNWRLSSADGHTGGLTGGEGRGGIALPVLCPAWCVCTCVCLSAYSNIWTMVHWHVRQRIYQWSYTAPFWTSAAPHCQNSHRFDVPAWISISKFSSLSLF